MPKKNASDPMEKLLSLLPSGDKKIKEMFLQHLADWTIASSEEFLQSQMLLFHKGVRGVVHDINNQLSIMSGKAFQIQRHIEKSAENKEKISESIARIENNCIEISKKLQSLRINTDPLADATQTTKNISSLLKNSIETLRQQLTKNQITISEEIEENLVSVNHPKLFTIFLSLLWNAGEAITRNAEATTDQNNSEKWIQVQAKANSSNIEIRIIDSGLTPTKDIQEKIMRPFFSTKSTSSKGLSLYAAKNYLESIGGKLYLDPSSTNTCFVIQIPIATSQELAA